MTTLTLIMYHRDWLVKNRTVNRKSTIFWLSSRKLVKIISSLACHFDTVSWLELKNCRFFIDSQILSQSHFIYQSLPIKCLKFHTVFYHLQFPLKEDVSYILVYSHNPKWEKKHQYPSSFSFLYSQLSSGATLIKSSQNGLNWL